MTHELALALVGVVGTLAGTSNMWGPKLFEWLKARAETLRHRGGSDSGVAEKVLDHAEKIREETGQHVAARFDCEDRVRALTAQLARLEERESGRDKQIARLNSELSHAMRRIENQSDEIRVLRERNIELTRELRTAYERIEQLTQTISQPPPPPPIPRKVI